MEYEGGKDTDGLTAEEILWKNAENYRRIIFNASAAVSSVHQEGKDLRFLT